MYIYGIISSKNGFIDISISEKGCKRYATINGYTKIGCRNVNSYNAIILAEKINNKLNYEKIHNCTKRIRQT